MYVLEQFKKDRIISNLGSYEVYYQVALGSLINETGINNVESEIDLQNGLSSIYEMCQDIKCLDNATEIFENELRKQAAMDAVQHFVNENLALIKNKEFDVEPIINKINDDLFFERTMIELCKKEKDTNIIKWKKIITDEIATSIYNSIKEL